MGTTQFANALSAAIEKTKQQNIENPEDRLRKLTQLYKEGLITDLEYENKRQEILKSI
ncbi:MAG: hypothetical protein Fur0022_21560 [Anaerolineales bacterium]